MNKRKTAYLLFALGLFFLEMHTTLPFLWQILGLPGQYPLLGNLFFYIASGFTPIVGAFVLLIAGLVYEKQGNPK